MNEQTPPVLSVNPPPFTPPKMSGLAIASLVLGILGVTCILPIIGSILAIIFGIVALNQISKSGGQITGQGQAVAGLITGGISLVMTMVMIPIMVAMLLPALSQARGNAQRATCMNNEKQIALAYLMYTQEHNGKCPQNLDDLRKYAGTDKIFRCPAACDQSKPSYQLFCGTNATDVIIREDPADHRDGGNVAYADGHVAWFPAQRGH
jgi:prepilin-type processing-associated H-X9-DG protein